MAENNDMFLICEKCGNNFIESFLQKNFSLLICNDCRQSKTIHKLITKTEAKKEFCLKDADFESRQPALKYILRKAKHSKKFHDMKLYVFDQVLKRAVDVWGSMDELEKHKEELIKRNDRIKEKKVDKKLKDIIKESSIRTHLLTSKHVHTFIEVNEGLNGQLFKKCTSCSFRFECETPVFYAYF